MNALKMLVPRWLKKQYWRHSENKQLMQKYGVDSPKHAHELDYWQSRWELKGNSFSNSHYQKIMLGMAGEVNDEFCRGKIVADFGCGPRGSLEWINSARLTIGIDVLADQYCRFGIAQHKACYVCSTEDRIPLPSNYVDVLYTMNSLDHVDHLEVHCAELLRILAPGGTLIGSFNLDEPSSECEPQSLNEATLEQRLLRHLDVTSYRIVPKPKDGADTYQNFFAEHPPEPDPTSYRILWARGDKPGKP